MDRRVSQHEQPGPDTAAQGVERGYWAATIIVCHFTWFRVRITT